MWVWTQHAFSPGVDVLLQQAIKIGGVQIANLIPGPFPAQFFVHMLNEASRLQKFPADSGNPTITRTKRKGLLRQSDGKSIVVSTVPLVVKVFATCSKKWRSLELSPLPQPELGFPWDFPLL